MREKLYADILQAMGTYSNRANMIRFFINGQGFGTFNMLDDVPQYSYIRAMFYDGKPPQQMGPLFDGASGASFQYSSNPDDYSSWIPNPSSPEDYTALNSISQLLNQTNTQDDGQLQTLAKSFEIDHFLRFMVMEYLTGSWDGYWMEQTNDGAYKDPTTNDTWYYLGQDYDATFGVNLDVPEGKDFVSVSYTQFPQRYPGAVMINKLLENANIKTKFETYLKNTTEILFNNYTLTNRVLAYHDFLLPDLAWDRSIVQQSPGINYGWTFDMVTQNLWQGVSGTNAEAPGGANQWGLLEWVVAKSQAVAKEFNIQIVTHPVLPASSSAASSAAASTGASSTGSHPTSSMSGVEASGGEQSAAALNARAAWTSVAGLAVGLIAFLVSF